MKKARKNIRIFFANVEDHQDFRNAEDHEDYANAEDHDEDFANAEDYEDLANMGDLLGDIPIGWRNRSNYRTMKRRTVIVVRCNKII